MRRDIDARCIHAYKLVIHSRRAVDAIFQTLCAVVASTYLVSMGDEFVQELAHLGRVLEGIEGSRRHAVLRDNDAHACREEEEHQYSATTTLHP